MFHQYFGINALFKIVVHLLFIYFSFWALQSLNLETLFRRKIGEERRIRAVFLLLAIVIGYNASSFYN